jgi:hypothetical protein
VPAGVSSQVGMPVSPSIKRNRRKKRDRKVDDGLQVSLQ